jgi:alpha-amylase/alpha-mannosidase (GH57 family)
MNRYLCIHGHFYQPPRENPWLEAVEVEDSAYPYHDWNERVTAECYGPNAASRILDGERRIVQIVNNYCQISFNFGPTLLAWLEVHHPVIYGKILDADRDSRDRFSGHGSALAQPYNHTILPLSNRRDKQTQILWGVHDFERRFGRPPRGAWLPETAVDLESLDLLAEAGIRFTLLAPHQARRVRPKGGAADAWRDVSGGGIDTTVPYEVALPSGRTIAVFFYDGATSRAVAFEGLLSSGERFADRLLSTVPGDPDRPRLAHIATDGETYGHHHRYGEMALSYAIHHIESNRLAKLTNYGEFLAAHPPEHQAEIYENTAWSCAHGVDRWRSDCGCHTGGQAGWSQSWRAPLRLALDWLRDELAPRFEKEAGKIFADPWAARDDYILVILNRSPENVAAFFDRHAGRQPEGLERVRALELLEMQRHTLLMYTSCGWFFNDVGGIETIQVLRYAGRAVQLAEQLFHESTEAQFLRRLQKARSNVPENGTGRDLYKKHVQPVDVPQVAAHYAVTSLFQDYPNPARVYCYAVERQNGRAWRAGRTRLSLGRVRVTSERTGKSELLAYGVLHFGDHNLNAGVKPSVDQEDHELSITEIGGAFEHGDLAQVIRLLDRYFGDVSLSLRSLFRDEQRRVLDLILASTLIETEDELRGIYLHQAPLMRFLNTLGTPLPNAFRAAAELVLNMDLRRSVESFPSDLETVQRLLDEARTLGVTLDTQGLGYALERGLNGLLRRLREHPEDLDLLRQVESIVALSRTPPFSIDLWRAQNRVYEMRRTVFPALQRQAEEGDAAAREWVEGFRKVAGELLVRVE